jgi:hypothetical protein
MSFVKINNIRKSTPNTEGAKTEGAEPKKKVDADSKVNNKEKQSSLSQLIFGDNKIKQMRKNWQEDIKQIHKNLDKIENDLKDLERLCKELNELLGGSNNNTNDFSSVLKNVSRLKENTKQGIDLVKNLGLSVADFKLENNSVYKSMSPDDKNKVGQKYEDIITQWKVLQSHFYRDDFNNNNSDENLKRENKFNPDKDNRKKTEKRLTLTKTVRSHNLIRPADKNKPVNHPSDEDSSSLSN